MTSYLVPAIAAVVGAAAGGLAGRLLQGCGFG